MEGAEIMGPNRYVIDASHNDESSMINMIYYIRIPL